MDSEMLQVLGVTLMLLCCWGVLFLWLPWVWLFHVENAKWLQAHGDLSRVTRWTLDFDRWLRRIGVERDR